MERFWLSILYLGMSPFKASTLPRTVTELFETRHLHKRAPHICNCNYFLNDNLFQFFQKRKVKRFNSTGGYDQS